MVSDGSRKSDRKYSRVYHEAVDDPKFAEVWDDDARLALWLRLLVMADAAWPASAPLPRSAKRNPLLALVTVGLVDLVGSDHFRIHGLDPERSRRSEAAALAANARWDANRITDSIASRSAVSMPRRDEHRKEEKETRVSLVSEVSVERATWARAQAGRDAEQEANRQERIALSDRFKRNEISEAEYDRLLRDIGKAPDDMSRVENQR